jgi:type VI secretion system protein VasG
VSLNLGALVKKLNKTCVDSLQEAAGLCLTKTHYSVEVEHWLAKLVDVPGSDFLRLIAHFQIDARRLRRDLLGSIDRLKAGNQRTPTLSPSIERLLKESWLIASVHFQASLVRSGHVVLALLSDEELGPRTRTSCPEWVKIADATLFDKLPSLIAGSIEDEPRSGVSCQDVGPKDGDSYLVDLSAKAVAEPDNPMVLGRESEVRRVVEVLNCRLKNVPVLLGEPGVGCGAVVEALARMVASGEALVGLDGHAVLTLDARSLVAEDDPSGKFAEVLKDLEGREQPVVLYIDGLDLIAGAGEFKGAVRLSNLLKAALARRKFRCIGSTADAEFRRIVKADPTIDRWLQPIPVKELSVEATVEVLRGMKVSFEEQHKVGISDPALVAAASLSARHLIGRFLPEKAISLVDEVASRKAFEKHVAASEVGKLRRRLRELLDAEQVATGGDGERVAREHQGAVKSVEEELRERLVRMEGEVGAADVVKAVGEKTGLSEEEILDVEAEPRAPDPALRRGGPPHPPARPRGTKVFISHSTQDRELVEREIIGLLHANGIEAWYSQDDIRPTDNWERTILRGLRSCEWFLLVMSPRSAQSEWVKDEISWAVDERPGRIIPVLIEDCQSSDFHIRLSRIQHVDLRESTPQARRLLLSLLEAPNG